LSANPRRTFRIFRKRQTGYVPPPSHPRPQRPLRTWIVNGRRKVPFFRDVGSPVPFAEAAPPRGFFSPKSRGPPFFWKSPAKNVPPMGRKRRGRAFARPGFSQSPRDNSSPVRDSDGTIGPRPKPPPLAPGFSNCPRGPPHPSCFFLKGRKPAEKTAPRRGPQGYTPKKSPPCR